MWYDPSKEADAASVLLAQGCDKAQHTDSLHRTDWKKQVNWDLDKQDQIKFAPKAQLTQLLITGDLII